MPFVILCYLFSRVLTGTVDERTIAKYEREAKEKNRESWYLAYVMDTNEEERAKVCLCFWKSAINGKCFVITEFTKPTFRGKLWR